MQQKPGFWNNPQKVMQQRSMILRQTDRNMSQTPSGPSLPAKPQTGIPTGVYIAGGIIVVAVIGIVAL